MTKQEPTTFIYYCAAYVGALTNSAVALDVSAFASEASAAAVAIGSAHGYEARCGGMSGRRPDAREAVEHQVMAMLAKPTVEGEHGEAVLIRATIHGEQIVDGEETGLIVVKTERGGEGAFLLGDMSPT